MLLSPTKEEAATQLSNFSQHHQTTRLERAVEGSFGLIQGLPVFKNMAPSLVFEILRSSHIAHHNKGAFILTQGEPLSHFFVILDGWVKLFKNSPDGKETVLLILGRKDYLLDTGLVENPVCFMNAQVIENVRLLAIPASIMREHFATSPTLAENMLSLSMKRTQTLFTHLEYLTLRDALDRVGGFLLKLWMETNPDGIDITLPFDKALIANYMNVRPETFSRLLKQLQQDGFIINKQQITLPHAKALCRFCDPATAQNCRHAEALCLEQKRPT